MDILGSSCSTVTRCVEVKSYRNLIEVLRHIASKSTKGSWRNGNFFHILAKMLRIWTRNGATAPKKAPIWLQILRILAFEGLTSRDFDKICRSQILQKLDRSTYTHRVKPLTRCVEVKSQKLWPIVSKYIKIVKFLPKNGLNMNGKGFDLKMWFDGRW